VHTLTSGRGGGEGANMKEAGGRRGDDGRKRIYVYFIIITCAHTIQHVRNGWSETLSFHLPADKPMNRRHRANRQTTLYILYGHRAKHPSDYYFWISI